MAQSEEQRLAALQAAGLSPEQQAGVISGTTITGADLGTVSAPNFQTPTYTPPPDISGIDTATKTATELSPAEQGVSDLTKRITDIQSSLAGKTTFQQEQETTLGVPGLEAEQNDLAALIKSYQSEALNLQNQKTLAEERILQESVGRGRTAGGISPLVAGEQRKITLQQADVASMALVASAAFDVTTGKIATANAKIKRALDAKFGAKEEEVKISLANLEILLKDPALDKATKDRANAQIQIQKSKEADIETKKKEQEEIWKSVTTAAANIKNFISTTEYPNAASAIQAMNEAKNKEEVLQIALKTGLTEKPITSGDIADFKAFFPNVDITTPTGQQQFLNWKARSGEAGRVEPKAEARDTEVSQYLESKKGTDGLTSAGSYQEALRKFIAGGGTQTNFLASFFPQTYLRQEEIDKLPAGLRQVQVAPIKTLTAEQQALINEAKSTWDASKQTYQATPDLRQKIIERAKQLGLDIS